jgi:anti-sigma B factor antagonist
MKVTLSHENDVSVISIEGSIDGKTAPLVRQEISPVLETAKSVIMDLSKVDFLSSAGLRFLLLVYRQITAKNGKLILLAVPEDIRTVMSHTGFLSFFTLAGSMPEALQALS